VEGKCWEMYGYLIHREYVTLFSLYFWFLEIFKINSENKQYRFHNFLNKYFKTGNRMKLI